jgi:hypothetical protein
MLANESVTKCWCRQVSTKNRSRKRRSGFCCLPSVNPASRREGLARGKEKEPGVGMSFSCSLPLKPLVDKCERLCACRCTALPLSYTTKGRSHCCQGVPGAALCRIRRTLTPKPIHAFFQNEPGWSSSIRSKYNRCITICHLAWYKWSVNPTSNSSRT